MFSKFNANSGTAEWQKWKQNYAYIIISMEGEIIPKTLELVRKAIFLGNLDKKNPKLHSAITKKTRRLSYLNNPFMGECNKSRH